MLKWLERAPTWNALAYGRRLLKSIEMSIIKSRNHYYKGQACPMPNPNSPMTQPYKVGNFSFVQSGWLQVTQEYCKWAEYPGSLGYFCLKLFWYFYLMLSETQELIICAGNSTTSALCFDRFCHVWLANLIAGHRKLHLCQEHSEQINVGGNQARSIVILKD